VEAAASRLIAGPVLHLLPYQRRWIDDNSQLKIVVKARQIGFSFVATLRAVLRCLERKTTWIFLSKGERQSRLLMEKVQEHIQTCGIVARASESTFFEGTMIKQLESRFSNGSVIYGLPANPDTARGYSGNVTLDEFAFHADADKIYAALFPTITRGYGLEVISTPNGQQGKFYELAKAAGLADPGFKPRISDPARLPSRAWSVHWCDVYEAVRQGLKIDIDLLRSGCDDESTWLQEFCCQFISTAENFIPPELIAACTSAEASAVTPPQLLASARPPGSEFFLGIDIGRHHDRTVFWLDEVVRGPYASLPYLTVSGPAQAAPGTDFQPAVPGVPPAHYSFRSSQTPMAVTSLDFGARGSGSEVSHFNSQVSLSIARLVRTLDDVPFNEQLNYARELLALSRDNGQPLVRRATIDSTGMGAPLAEALVREFGPRVEPVIFTGAVKEDLAYRTKRRLENRLSLLPDTREIRRAFAAVKRMVTPTGNLRFDAERTEAGHADEFWAKALADLAAESQPVASLADGFLADSTPLISPRAFLETEGSWTGIL
jgi:phage FluMu gp28-like protein